MNRVVNVVYSSNQRATTTNEQVQQYYLTIREAEVIRNETLSLGSYVLLLIVQVCRYLQRRRSIRHAHAQDVNNYEHDDDDDDDVTKSETVNDTQLVAFRRPTNRFI